MLIHHKLYDSYKLYYCQNLVGTYYNHLVSTAVALFRDIPLAHICRIWSDGPICDKRDKLVAVVLSLNSGCPNCPTLVVALRTNPVFHIVAGVKTSCGVDNVGLVLHGKVQWFSILSKHGQKYIFKYLAPTRCSVIPG